MKYLNPLSRALIALIFLISGIGKLTNFQGTVALAGGPLPFPGALIFLAAVLEIAGGLALLAGWQVKWASLALFLYLIPATLVYHASHLTDPGQAQMQLIEVLKNLAIMGGLLKFFVDATTGVGGRLSPTLDERLEDLRTRRAS